MLFQVVRFLVESVVFFFCVVTERKVFDDGCVVSESTIKCTTSYLIPELSEDGGRRGQLVFPISSTSMNK